MDDAEIFRLFLGMGSIWYFEIISSFIGNTGGEGWSHFSIVPDLINAMQVKFAWKLLESNHCHLCQGVWVFITFVCKRNVIQVITMKKDRLYSAVMNRSRSGERCQCQYYLIQLVQVRTRSREVQKQDQHNQQTPATTEFLEQRWSASPHSPITPDNVAEKHKILHVPRIIYIGW